MLLALLAFFSSWFSSEPQPQKEPWVILYTNYVLESSLKPYDPVIFDARTHPPMEEIAKTKKGIFARIDIEKLFYEFPEFAPYQKLPPGPVPICCDAPVIKWLNHIIEKEIAPLVDLGFNGIFLDRISEWKTATEGTRTLIHAIPQLVLLMRLHFPKTSILIQSDARTIDEVSGAIEGVIKFSVITTYNAETNHYEYVDPKVRNETVIQLERIKEKYPQLKIFTLDFWDPYDGETIRKIYEAEEGEGFRPYVTDGSLSKVVSR